MRGRQVEDSGHLVGPIRMHPPEPVTPLLRVDVINGWPLIQTDVSKILTFASSSKTYCSLGRECNNSDLDFGRYASLSVFPTTHPYAHDTDFLTRLL